MFWSCHAYFILFQITPQYCSKLPQNVPLNPTPTFHSILCSPIKSVYITWIEMYSLETRQVALP